MTDQACANTAPASYRCGWCDERLVREPGGYWWQCPSEFGHPSSHDPRRRGPRAWWNALRARWSTVRCDSCHERAIPERILTLRHITGDRIYYCDGPQCRPGGAR